MGELLPTPPPQRHYLIRHLATACAVGLVLAAPGAAVADDRTFAVPPGSAAQAPKLPEPAPGPVQTARLQAKKTGKPVTVDELTTETSLTVAGPDGKLTATTHLQAARVKKNGTWTAVDATLARNPDGGYSPTATPSGVTLSGGGTGPLATLTDKDGHSFALAFPAKLPAPTVTGSAATYAEVLPGVDLRVDVTTQGAVREVLAVKDASAAANPALKSLKLGTGTTNLTVSADAHGNLTAAAADGKPVFRAPSPLMWDSASDTPAPPTTPTIKAAAAPLTSSTSGPISGGAQAGAGDSESSTDGPGRGAHIKPIAVEATTSALTLTPDADLLGGKDTVWPLYIDPTFQPAPTMGTNHFAQVMQGCPTSPQYDIAQDNGQGVGFQHYRTNCYGMERSYYEFNTSAVAPQMYIDDAKMYFTETYGASWDCGHTAPVALKWMREAIDGGTDWNHQPTVYQDISGQWPKSAYGKCGWQTVTFNVTDALRSVAQAGSKAWTVGLFGDENNSTNNDNFMRFAPNPYLIATYDLPPNTPDSMYTSPQPINPNGYACGGGQPGWIGRTVPLGNGASDITLHAYGSTPMPGTNIVIGFHVWDNMAADANGSPATVTWPASQSINGRGWGDANIGFPVSDGHQYGWNAWATDGLLGSAGTAYCYFNVDLTPPTLAYIAPSTVFPPIGSGIKPTGHAGDQGATIRVTSTDPVPGGCTRGSCLSSGVREFQYNLDDNIPPTGYKAQPVAGVDANGSAYADIPINLNPDQWGTHRLYVRATDNAGNTQPQAATYDFYAPWNPATKVVAGDVNFDGTPDYLVPAADGSLTLLPGNSDFTAQSGTASTKTQSPEQDSWNNYLIAHRGSVSANSVDDLLAYNKSSKQLYIYFNDSTRVPAGTPGHFSDRAGIAQIGNRTDCARGVDGTWNNLTQLTALSATPTSASRPNLITIEAGHLRYYPGTTVGGCLLAQGIELGADNENWSSFTLLSPGIIGNTPALWVRDSVTGAINTFPLPLTDGAPAAKSLHVPAHQALVSAVKNPAGANMCADVDRGLPDNGTTAQLWDCNTTGAQAFTRGIDSTLHVLGKCLDIKDAATGNGSGIQLWDCNNTGAQKWADGPYSGTLQNPQSGRCLAVPEGKNDPGNHLILWDCLDDVSQKWTSPTAQAVLPLGASSAAYPTVDSPGDINGDGNPDLITTDTNGIFTQYLGTAPDAGLPRFGTPRTLPSATPASYNISSAQNPNRCFDNWGAGNGTSLLIYNCWNGTNQKLTFAADGTLRTGGRCVATKDNATANGTAVVILDCTGATGQVWTLRADGTIYSPTANRCIELPGWNDANSTALDIWDCVGNHANQRWTIYPNTA
ncbi:ricin-type beta-trefoil lectin domain protein [Kitasatospora sp. NPDC059803]|uniref:ricin-type beta-trefoil lectin domain protein n=1 Tax=Kitasatospora sp. NPDC059803 TaxID=3346953 RepID=UPI00366394F9